MMIRHAAAQTNFGHADSKLTELANALFNLRDCESFSYDEARAYGASECNGLIAASYERDREATAIHFGFESYEQAVEAIAERTTNRYVYMYGNF